MAQTPEQMAATKDAFAKAKAEGRVRRYSGYEVIEKKVEPATPAKGPALMGELIRILIRDTKKLGLRRGLGFFLLNWACCK